MIEPSEKQQERGSRNGVSGHQGPNEPDERVGKHDGLPTELASKVAEDVITERVLARLGGAVGGVLYDAIDPRPLALLPHPTASPPEGAVLHPPPPPAKGPRSWFVFQLWAEVRLTARMYFDPHYRISRTAQFLLPVIIGLFFLNYFFFAVWFAIPVVSPIAERIVCVLLGVCAYRVVARELTRYRDVLEYLAKYVPR
jgi:hypothetical protein